MNALILAALAATAAPAPTAPPPMATIQASPISAVLPTGTRVSMRTLVSLTTKGKMVRVGDRIPLEVAEAVYLNDEIVIPSGSPGMAEVTEVRNKGMWGKSGALNARILYLRVGTRQIRLSGTFDDKGKTGTGGVVAAVAFLPVAGFFTTGTSASIPQGSNVSAFTDEDVAVSLTGIPSPVQPPVVVKGDGGVSDNPH